LSTASEKTFALLQLARPANLPTAMADIGAGFSAGFFATQLTWEQGPALLPSLGLLLMASVCLYGGGVAFNDVFDANLDRTERPERPIPSGRVTFGEAIALAGTLLLLGVVLAFLVSFSAGMFALAIAGCAVLYDAWGKHQRWWGPVNMGLCRGLNLLLGASLFPGAVETIGYIAVIPVVYIAAITMISRGEVHGKNLQALKAGALMYGLVMAMLIFIGLQQPLNHFLFSLPFLGLFAFLVYPPLFKAIGLMQPAYIGKAVKAGVIALITLDATMAAMFVGWLPGIAILLLLPVSKTLASFFAVT
jgi:4-hydroxybenzoate polyprenyltransferase